MTLNALRLRLAKQLTVIETKSKTRPARTQLTQQTTRATPYK
jgi:hypothetical protein